MRSISYVVITYFLTYIATSLCVTKAYDNNTDNLQHFDIEDITATENTPPGPQENYCKKDSDFSTNYQTAVNKKEKMTLVGTIYNNPGSSDSDILCAVEKVKQDFPEEMDGNEEKVLSFLGQRFDQNSLGKIQKNLFPNMERATKNPEPPPIKLSKREIEIREKVKKIKTALSSGNYQDIDYDETSLFIKHSSRLGPDEKTTMVTQMLKNPKLTIEQLESVSSVIRTDDQDASRLQYSSEKNKIPLPSKDISKLILQSNAFAKTPNTNPVKRDLTLSNIDFFSQKEQESKIKEYLLTDKQTLLQQGKDGSKMLYALELSDISLEKKEQLFPKAYNNIPPDKHTDSLDTHPHKKIDLTFPKKPESRFKKYLVVDKQTLLPEKNKASTLTLSDLSLKKAEPLFTTTYNTTPADEYSDQFTIHSAYNSGLTNEQVLSVISNVESTYQKKQLTNDLAAIHYYVGTHTVTSDYNPETGKNTYNVTRTTDEELKKASDSIIEIARFSSTLNYDGLGPNQIDDLSLAPPITYLKEIDLTEEERQRDNGLNTSIKNSYILNQLMKQKKETSGDSQITQLIHEIKSNREKRITLVKNQDDQKEIANSALLRYKHVSSNNSAQIKRINKEINSIWAPNGTLSGSYLERKDKLIERRRMLQAEITAAKIALEQNMK